MCSALSYPYLADFRAAHPAWLTFPSVHTDHKFAGLEDAVDIGTAELHGFVQHSDHCLMQPGHLVCGKLRCTAQRVNSCPEQALISIDVSDSCQTGLVKQQRFDMSSVTSQARDEQLFRYPESVRPQRTNNLIRVVDQPYATEFSRIVEMLAVSGIQRERQACVVA